MEFKDIDFSGERKTGEAREKPSEQGNAMSPGRPDRDRANLVGDERSQYSAIRSYYLFYMLPYDFAFAHCNYKERNTKTILGTQLLTSSLSVEPNPHGDMTVPRDWMEPDIFRVESSLKSVRHVAITVPISWEYLY